MRTIKRRRNTKKRKNNKRVKKTRRQMKGGLFGIKLPNFNPMKVTLSNRELKTNTKKFLILPVNLDKSVKMWQVLGYSREQIEQIIEALDNKSDDKAVVPRMFTQTAKDENYNKHCTIDVELINRMSGMSGDNTKIVDLARDIITRADAVDYKSPITIDKRNGLSPTNQDIIGGEYTPTNQNIGDGDSTINQDLVDIKVDLDKVDGEYKLTDEDIDYIDENIEIFRIYSGTVADKCKKITKRDGF